MSKEDVTAFIEEAEKLAVKTQQELGAERYAELRGRRGKEVELWHTWNNGGRTEEHLVPLLASVQPMIRREATKRLSGLGGAIPRSAMETALQRATLKAFENYDPARLGATGKPTQLSTHIHNNFQRVTDFVAAQRNARSLPRNKLDKAGEFNAAREEFHQEHGRLPTLAELAAKLPGRKPKELAELSRALAPEVFTHVGGGLTDDNAADVDKYRAGVLMVYGQLSPAEREFADLHYPAAGEPPMNVKQIAKKMGIPQHKVYRLRTRVDNRIAPLIKSS